ncbi:MAG: hypothetical protein KBT06_08265 [Prevotellaceae bacterium]|nr:hypothetical protein [Candidatus Colivivens equi]
MTINAMLDEQVSVPAFSASPQHSSNEFDSAFSSLKIRFVENSLRLSAFSAKTQSTSMMY